MIDHAALLADLRAQVRSLETDLRSRSADVPDFDSALRAEWQQAHDAERIAAGYEQWLDGEITQTAVAWILGTVFLRFCEDNELIDDPYLAGPGESLAIASERQQAFFEKNPAQTDRDWIIEGFDALATASPVAAGLFDRTHNPMWRITPSHDAAKSLLAFWRTRTEGETSPVRHDFKDPSWNTRFLGDLYQDLSDHAKKTYALLQTPEFVEEFILDLTLTPAINEFGLTPDPPRARPDLPRTLRVIDPACGSGHFLLGAFTRLLEKWKDLEPGTDSWQLIRRVLEGLHGADKNPFAVSIARFRLLIAAMKAGQVKHLTDAPVFPINIAIADSLLHGRGAPGVQGELFNVNEIHTYQAEDVEDYIRSVDILGANSYQVAVGNPPYFTVNDKRENANYRRHYSTCSGKYTLSVPFTERLFHLAINAEDDGRRPGYVGQITTNAFMKRAFGKRLIEEYLMRRVRLTHILDCAGAHLPGFGVPTVILIGRNQNSPLRTSIRTAMGLQGKTWEVGDPPGGAAWAAMVNQIDLPGSESDWINVDDSASQHFATHPWSLAGGGAAGLAAQIESMPKIIMDLSSDIGMTTLTLEDDVFLVPDSLARRRRIEGQCVRLVNGDEVRDYSITMPGFVLMPVTWSGASRPLDAVALRHLWPWHVNLRNRLYFGMTPEQRDLRWFDLGIFFASRHKTPLSLSFAEMGTHNHFALDRGGKVFKQSAPVVKLPEEATESDYLALLPILNSSTACFWLKHVSHNYGDKTDARGARVTGAPYFDTYDFTSTNLKQMPLPDNLPLSFGRALDALAQRLNGVQPSAACASGIPTRDRLDSAHTENDHIRGQMIALQEELDWEVYRLYALLTDQEAAELRAEPDVVPELNLGERAFEIVLARKMAGGEIETQWFARHGSTPITEIPTHWPESYRQVVEHRIDTITKRRDIALIERPECKRRWSTDPWEKKEKAALRAWLLDRCEDRVLWFAQDDTGTDQPCPMTVHRLADKLRNDQDFVSVARLYAGPDAELSAVIAEITDAEHVPYLSAFRYKDTGLRKRLQWERTWDLQRQEDVTGQRLNIPVPPKYTSADFRKTSYWSNRGKLDVPKERFISYPQASPDGDNSMLLGWAGWDHRQQAHALMTIIEDRTSRDGWDKARLVPLIAGLAEVLPWVRQWHADVDPAFGTSPADAYAGYLEDQQFRHGLTASDLAAWQPQPVGRGRRPRSGALAAQAADTQATLTLSTTPADTQTRHTSTP